MRALSIRRPYAEEIPSTYSGQALRGIKTIEYRNRPTTIIGETFYIYAAMKPAEGRGIKKRFAALGCEPGGLPTGVIVGTAKISHCTGAKPECEWHLTDVKRLDPPRKPKHQPQPSWFIPF